MYPPWQPSSLSISMRLEPSTTSIMQVRVQMVEEQSALITPPPELRLRSPIPEPQNNADCGEASRSASEAIRQANQSASQSIQQASQQASQSIQQANQQASQAAQQASQSASQAIQQFSNQASQSIAAASRSVSSAIASADQAIANAKSSADAAIGRANGSMMTAQASASSAQADASRAVLQAGAAVAAATGSAAAAGSSFLAAAAKATQGAQASISGISAAAASFAAQAGDQVQESRTAAVTATQAALAIVGSIIASTLITILIYFLVIRHKRIAKRKSRGTKSPNNDYSSEPKFPISDQVGTTVAASNSSIKFNETRNGPPTGTSASFSLFPKISDKADEAGAVKTTVVPWNPSKPPKAPTLAPTLGSWLKLQDGVSPFGPIKLPDEKTPLPLGGQLKSPLRSISTRRAPPSPIQTPMMTPANSRQKSPRPKNLNPESPRDSQIPTAVWSPKIAKLITIGNSKRIPPGSKRPRSPTPKKPDTLPQHSIADQSYRESKASIWTDDVPSPSPFASPPLRSPPPPQQRGLGKSNPQSVTQFYNMEIPPPVNPVRNTAEWLAARKAERTSLQTSQADMYPSSTNNDNDNRKTLGLPGNPRQGLPTRPGPRQIQSMEGEVGYVEGLSRFLSNNRGSQMSRMGSDKSTGRSIRTPGVGKAM
ncbi:hypothetical protein BKA65DRAFT_259826 [Rhexocercosporidium sp. MPI-PUGE-AT-0058]|nr:hypothetical protein BKA65DRAFT_259826 [Rhexocercosporidium sp. MPI-PUGE-AT-0058]